ncbi:major facilitator superfamily transporter [Xylaria sp. CBS 124048]|nr:major facilitator superfamily transporter [Xylaria sp. CBS 124048]
MNLDEVDRELMRAETDAQTSAVSPLSQPAKRGSNEIERSALSKLSSSSSEMPGFEMTSMSRVPTSQDLERHPTELSRIRTALSQHSSTVGRDHHARTRESMKSLPAFGGGKDYPPTLPNREAYVVEFDGPDDPAHPQNWPFKKKIITAIILCYTTITVAFGSSIFSAGTINVAEEFGVSLEVTTLTISLYVLGFAFGPMLWAPLSELKGRRLPVVLAMFGFSIFAISCAVAKDLQTIMITRFFMGFFGASPLAVVGAVFSDMFNNATRGIALTLFTMGVFTGPLLAPFVGGFISQSYLGWRWTMYIVSFMGFFGFVLDFFLMKETYPPVVLVEKASMLRRKTLNWGIHAKQEEIEIDFKELIQKNFTRPIRLLIFEPIVALISIYIAFIYGLLYLFLTAYPLVFSGVHGFNAGQSGLAFFGMVIGQVIGGIVVLLAQPAYQRKLAANGGIPIPEWRLPLVAVGGAAFAAGLFWFGWSGYREDIHWIVPAASGLLSGFGLLTIFLQALNYLVDAYLMFAASAIAANTFLRSICAAGFPLFATYMFKGLGIQYASTLLGGFAVLLIPIPILFYMYGHKIRAKSSFSPTLPGPVASPPSAAGPEKEEGGEGEEEDQAAASNVPRRENGVTGDNV